MAEVPWVSVFFEGSFFFVKTEEIARMDACDLILLMLAVFWPKVVLGWLLVCGSGDGWSRAINQSDMAIPERSIRRDGIGLD